MVPFERNHWGLRGSSLWGHEACEGWAENGVVVSFDRSHWDLRWSSLWGHEACEECADMGAIAPCELSR
eukprot:4302655-Pyramimonas_sp.AAC.1